ncbi:MAG: hypothetical protein H7144_08450, partial [Burkholderiales bacterium]|nr:hypothetical protein [Phycisphaerae bacterium]
MTTWTDIANDLMGWITRTTWQSALLMAGVLLVQLGFGRWIAPRLRTAMWLLVFVR